MDFDLLQEVLLQIFSYRVWIQQSIIVW